MIFTHPTHAQVVEQDQEAFWDYGVGLGAVHYEHYPAANQFSDLALPSPTFQYRGKILRADDRDGAHLYIFKSTEVTLEFSGVGYPTLNSANNDARTGMDNLPWMVALGPQLVFRPSPRFEFAMGAYQAITTDFMMTRFQGGIFEGRFTFIQDFDFFDSQIKISYSRKYATQELQSLYYEVPAEKSLLGRPAYDAQDGLLSEDLSYYQNFKSGRWTWALGLSVGFYKEAANAQSPLHKSDLNLTGFMGVNYVLGGSKKPAVPEEDTSGLINSLRRQRDLQSQ